jgi:hypothetical protein
MRHHAIDSSGFGEGQVTGFCEHGNGPLGCIICGKFDMMKNYPFPNKASSPSSYFYLKCRQINVGYGTKYLLPIIQATASTIRSLNRFAALRFPNVTASYVASLTKGQLHTG